MIIALAQLNFKVGDFDLNTAKIIDSIRKAKQHKAQLIIFPELSLSAYPPRDFLEYKSFVERNEKAIDEIAPHCISITAIIGSVSRNKEKQGKKLYNSGYVLANGMIQDVVHKTLLPDYDIFDEYRYFEPNKSFSLVQIGEKKIALTICEDIWNIHTTYYSHNPMDELIKLGPDLMINIAASPFSYQHDKMRLDVLQTNAKKYSLPLIYVNHCGAQTDIIFDGLSRVITSSGDIALQLNAFEEEIAFYDTESVAKPCIAAEQTVPIELIHSALICGIRDFFCKLGFKKAILGLSGGIDSALCAALLQQALGADNVKGLLMPSEFSSEHSIKDAVDLALKLKIPYEIISIKSLYGQFNNVLHPYFEGSNFDLTEENLQARIRALLLMAFSNKFGYILINTSNKSEIAVGYGTLYGDMCGALSVIGDLYKTQVYELSEYINRDEEIITVNSIKKTPSAELRPDQKDSDSLPEYDILDKILFHYIEEQMDYKEIAALGFDESVVNKVIRLVNSSEFKRHQAAPVLRISGKSFGIGRQMPIVAHYNSSCQ